MLINCSMLGRTGLLSVVRGNNYASTASGMTISWVIQTLKKHNFYSFFVSTCTYTILIYQQKWTSVHRNSYCKFIQKEYTGTIVFRLRTNNKLNNWLKHCIFKTFKFGNTDRPCHVTLAHILQPCLAKDVILFIDNIYGQYLVPRPADSGNVLIRPWGPGNSYGCLLGLQCAAHSMK